MRLREMITCFLVSFFICCSSAAAPAGLDTGKGIRLPEPNLKGEVSVEEAIYGRRSVRDFSGEPLDLKDVAQLLWAAGGATVDGITGPSRSYPSAGAVYPLDIYLVAGNVKRLDPGVYYYEWRKNMLIPVKKGDVRAELSRAALGQQMIARAPASIVVIAQHAKTARRYGQRGAVRYVAMDTGHMGENVHLQAQAMGLGTVMVGAFMDTEVLKAVGVKNELPVYIMPVGRPKS